MSLREQCILYEFKELGDERGKLVAIEALKDIPFDVKRIFYIYGMDSATVRGKHANKKSEFVMINLRGTCKVKLYDDYDECIIELNRPNLGLYIPKLIWKDMYDFSDDSILLVLSNEYYDSSEYIRK